MSPKEREEEEEKQEGRGWRRGRWGQGQLHEDWRELAGPGGVRGINGMWILLKNYCTCYEISKKCYF